MSYWVYILRTARETLYTGVARDVEKRFEEHASPKSGAKYTKANKPVEIVYRREFQTRSEAQREEARIKRLSRAQKILLIAQSSRPVSP
jgi:putative endonuclease